MVLKIQKRLGPEVALALALAGLVGCGRGKSSSAPPPYTVIQGALTPLTTAFNAAAGLPRALLIVSPT